MSLSPIATLVTLAGSEAVVTTVPVAAPSAYDPDAAEDQRAPAPGALTLRGVYSKISMAGVEVKHAAMFLVAAEAMPADVTPDASRCTANGITYIVRQVDPRWYLGVFDGFTLHLGL